jgi:hypothetical protein
MLERQKVTLRQDARSTALLRIACVEAAKELGLDQRYAGQQPAQPAAPQPQAPAGPGQGVTPQQRQDKLALAAAAPPNTNATGIPSGPTDAASDYSKMSVFDLTKLPKDKLEQLAFGSG